MFKSKSLSKINFLMKINLYRTNFNTYSKSLQLLQQKLGAIRNIGLRNVSRFTRPTLLRRRYDTTAMVTHVYLIHVAHIKKRLLNKCTTAVGN